MRKLAAALAAAAFLVVGFSTPRATSRSAACPSLSDASRLKTAGPTLRGDVDGDGRLDRVSVVYAPTASGTCGIVLLVRMAHGDRAARLAGIFRGPATYSIQFGVPRLLGVLRLGDGAARQIVVEVDEGAHATSYAVYGIWRGSLVRTAVGTPSGVFIWNAGATNFGNVVCRAAGKSTMVDGYGVDIRYPKPGWYLETSSYRLVGNAFVRTRVSDRVVGDEQVKKVRRAFGETPFGHCAGERAK